MLRNKIRNTISRKELLDKRDEAIRKDFNQMTKVKKLDVEYVICEVLQHKYFIQPSSIMLILKGTYQRGIRKN
jgi:hypothetical protein